MSIEALSSSKNINDFSKSVEEYLLNHGIKYFCLHPVPFNTSNIVTNLPSKLIERYFIEKYSDFDYVIDHAENLHKVKTKSLYRHVVYDYSKNAPVYTEKNEKNVEISSLLNEYGFLDAYYILFQTPTKNNFVASILSKDLERDDFKNAIESRYDFIHLLFEVIVGICSSRFSKTFFGSTSNTLITYKQSLLINYLGKEDLTLQRAADRMHISLDTANKHIAAAKTALGTKTIAGIIYWGIRQGVIDLNETIHPRERRQNQVKEKPKTVTAQILDDKIIKLAQN